MTGYLGRLIDRTTGRALVLQPLVASRFDPAREASQPRSKSLLTAQVETLGDDPSPGAISARPVAAAAAPASPGPNELRRDPAPPAHAPTPVAAAPAPREADGREHGASPAPERPALDVRADELGALEVRLRAAATDARHVLAEAGMKRPSEDGEGAAARQNPTPPTDPQPIAAHTRRAPDVTAPQSASGPTAAPRALSPPPPLTLAAPQNPTGAAAASQAKEELPPAIHVTIGRVEVRAVQPPSKAARAAPRLAEARITLDDYLQRREQRDR